MNRLLFRTTLGALLSCAALAIAHAEWSVNVAPPDAFGNRKAVAAVAARDGNGLVVQCNRKNVLAIAYIFPITAKKRAEMKSDGPLPVSLMITIDNGTPMKLDALMQVWNDAYGGYVAYGRTGPLIEAVKGIAAATFDVEASVQATGIKADDHFTDKGSTLAMNTLTKSCDLASVPDPEATELPPGLTPDPLSDTPKAPSKGAAGRAKASKIVTQPASPSQ